MLFRGVVYIDKSRGVFNLKPANRAAMGKTKHSGRIVIQNPPQFLRRGSEIFGLFVGNVLQ